MRKIPFAGIELTSQRVRGYMVPLSYRGDQYRTVISSLVISGGKYIRFGLRIDNSLHPFCFCFIHVFLEMSLFPSIFVPLPFSLCMESTITVVRFFPSRMVFFLPCDQGLDY